MPAFVHLENPDTYRPGLWDLSADAPARARWRDRLERSVRDMVALVRAEMDESERDGARADDPQVDASDGDRRERSGRGPQSPESRGRISRVDRIRTVHRDWVAFLDRHLIDPDLQRRYPTVHALVTERERLLRHHGIPDVFDRVKREENARCLPLFTETVAVLEAAREPMDAALWGLLAGNVFDMANPDVQAAYHAGQLRLADLAREVRARPLAMDGRSGFRAALDRLTGAAAGRRPRVILFVDNAGMDFVLGAVPFARLLVSAGFEVVIAANELPALNDITAAEAVDVMRELSERDGILAAMLSDERLMVVSTGNGNAGIDLRDVSPELNGAAAAADLLVLVGQGRGIETTWTARLARPALRVATLKSPLVGERLGWRVFDPILDFREAGEPASAAMANGS